MLARAMHQILPFFTAHFDVDSRFSLGLPLIISQITDIACSSF